MLTPELKATTKHAIFLIDVIQLTLQLVDVQVETWFGVVKNPAVELLLETKLMDRYVCDIFLNQ